MGTCVRCGSGDLKPAWEWRWHRIGRHVFAGRVATVTCSACGARWPWAQSRFKSDPGLLERLSPAVLYLQSEGDLIVVRRPDGRYEVVS